MSLSQWAVAQSESSSWIRKMFAEGERLRAEFGAEAVTDLSLGQPLEAPSEVHQAFERAASENFPFRHAYIPNLGYAELRERLAREDVAVAGVDSDCISVTTGAAGAIVVALRTFVDTGAEVIGFAPFFPEFPGYCSALGLNFVACRTDGDGAVDMDEFLRALSERTQAVIVNSPSNPSGHVFTEAEWDSLVDALELHNRRTNRRILLIVDEAYRRLHWTSPRINALALYEHTVLARSFSKDMGLAGERIGYLAMHPSLARSDSHAALGSAMRALGMVNAPATAQRALLQLPQFDFDVDRYLQRRDLAVTVAEKNGLRFLEPQGGIFLWVQSPWPDTVEFVKALATEKVLTTPGVAFGVRDYIRVCFSADVAAIQRGLAAMAKVATALRSADFKAGYTG